MSVYYNETESFLSLTSVEFVSGLDAIPFVGLLEAPATLMREHSGKCPCGKGCFLFGQCPKCMKEELSDQRKEEGPEEAPEPEGEDLAEYLESPPGALQESGTCLVPSSSSAGVHKFPTSLPMPIVRRGLVTQCVHFIAARAVNGILNESEGSGPTISKTR